MRRKIAQVKESHWVHARHAPFQLFCALMVPHLPMRQKLFPTVNRELHGIAFSVTARRGPGVRSIPSFHFRWRTCCLSGYVSHPENGRYIVIAHADAKHDKRFSSASGPLNIKKQALAK
ncbi:hypothetical protein PGT21_027549 [Puccinia graminis f. sp. tritici]|uniref:Uncharacterized protein n=1 Tax=Puccinia graminis f. sp. tritici TaxID=56615 RepID=A0A5B0MMC0_PUCGR|nr:hypothetical protein PGT21_027549 [Puccinia graminis f. sp. tritici]KAA1085182.1 hypothetical protein PGTUg99_013358 [Puccinia graminis f. sp. tritici]